MWIYSSLGPAHLFSLSAYLPSINTYFVRHVSPSLWLPPTSLRDADMWKLAWNVPHLTDLLLLPPLFSLPLRMQVALHLNRLAVSRGIIFSEARPPRDCLQDRQVAKAAVVSPTTALITPSCCRLLLYTWFTTSCSYPPTWYFSWNANIFSVCVFLRL